MENACCAGSLRELDSKQWRAFIAAFLGWTLGASIFGLFAEECGRRGPLMASVLIYSFPSRGSQDLYPAFLTKQRYAATLKAPTGGADDAHALTAIGPERRGVAFVEESAAA